MVPATDPPRPEHAPAGYDEDDPYEGEDIETYPDWWRANIEEFREHEMRPYRPPRFSDGKITPELVAELERDLGVDVLIRAVNPDVDDDWSVLVDGREVATIGRHRSGEGYTVYEMTGDAFASMVRDAVDRRRR